MEYQCQDIGGSFGRFSSLIVFISNNFKPVDLAQLPRRPLSMSILIALESRSLRRLLKGGLKRGLTTSELERLLRAEWDCSLDSERAIQLLDELQERGWFGRHGDFWKTHVC